MQGLKQTEIKNTLLRLKYIQEIYLLELLSNLALFLIITPFQSILFLQTYFVPTTFKSFSLGIKNQTSFLKN